MKKYLMTILTGMVLFSSCKKELSNEKSSGTTGSAGGPSDSLLMKTVERGGSDSIVTIYGYDASRRLISRDVVETFSSVNNHNHLDFKRNTNGIITQVVYKSDSLVALGIDSAVFKINYNSSSSKYVSMVGTTDQGGSSYSDSTAYTYNSNSRISQSEEFLGSGGVYIALVKTIFSYDGTGSITDTKMYAKDSSNIYQFVNENTYQYDLNVNPLKVGFESFVLNDPTMVSSYNVINAAFNDEQDPTNNYSYNESYNYNSIKKPMMGIKTYPGFTGSASVTYYYQ